MSIDQNVKNVSPVSQAEARRRAYLEECHFKNELKAEHFGTIVLALQVMGGDAADKALRFLEDNLIKK